MAEDPSKEPADHEADDPAKILVESLESSELETLHNSLSQLIPIREAGIRYAESRLNSLALLSGGFIAAAIAVLSLALGQSSGPAQAILGATSLALVLLAGALLWVYTASTNPRYPFIDPAGTLTQARWKWFYWDALPRPNKLAQMNVWGRISDAAHQEEVAETATQYQEFVTESGGRLSKQAENAADDLRQLFTLHVNERYKNQYLKNTRQVLRSGLVLGAVFVGVVAAVAFFAARDDSRVTGSSITELPIGTVTAEWDEVDQGTEARTRLIVALGVSGDWGDESERASAVSDLSTVVAEDSFSFELPIELLSFTVVSETAILFEAEAEVLVPSSYVGSIATFEPR